MDRQPHGIRQRYFCGEGETATTLAIDAAQKALAASGLNPSEIGCVLVATSSGEYVMPSTACLVHAALGLPQDIPAMDVGAACAGFLFAMETARGLLLANQKRYALVIGAEQMSSVLDMTDRNTCVLFGDGAGAAIFELCADAPYEHIVGRARRHADPRRRPAARAAHDDGRTGRLRFAVTTIPQCVNALVQKAGITTDDIDWVVCHQANVRILDASIRRLGMPAEKFYRNLDRYANTSAASIPLALDEMRENGLLQPGQKMILVGFGGGLTWAGVYMEV